MNDENLKADDLADIDDDDNENFLKLEANVGYADPAWEMEVMEEVLMQYRGTGKRVVIANSNVIGSYAFANNEALEEIVFGPQVEKILNNAFVNCINLRSIKFERKGKAGIVYIADAAFSGCERLRSFELPDTLRSIGSAAFTGCSSLGHIEIPDSVVSIGEAAFAGCTELSITKLPKDLKVIESNVFSQVAFVCDLPESVLIIKEEAYEYCFPRDFYVPKSVKYIGRNAFPPLAEYEDDNEYCILFGGAEEEWNAIEIDRTGGWLDGYKIKFNCERRD